MARRAPAYTRFRLRNALSTEMCSATAAGTLLEVIYMGRVGIRLRISRACMAVKSWAGCLDARTFACSCGAEAMKRCAAFEAARLHGCFVGSRVGRDASRGSFSGLPCERNQPTPVMSPRALASKAVESRDLSRQFIRAPHSVAPFF